MNSLRTRFADRPFTSHRPLLGMMFAVAAAALGWTDAARAQAVGDFDNDGFADLAIGAPGESVGDGLDAGVVHVLYGTANGLASGGAQVWHLNVAGIPGNAETGDFLGRAIAVGDFNGDNFDDIVIGVPGREVSNDHGAGAVLVIYGSASGLTSVNSKFWDQDTQNVEDGAQANDAFGNALTSGDYNGDGFDDIAIGVPGEDSDIGLDAGAIAILYGSLSGITAVADQFFQQDAPGIDGTAEGSDSFGEALASGDFNGDGRDDLAVAVSNETLGNADHTGVVHVLFGTVGGITSGGAQTWSQDVDDVPEKCEDDDNFGAALAAGDFDDDGFDDLAIGVAEESVGDLSDAGGVLVLRGDNAGLTTNGVKFFTQNQGDIKDACQQGDRFGSAVATGDFNNDGFEDLAIGVPNEKIGDVVNCGAVNVIKGSANGLTGGGNQFWHQNSEGILDKCESGDAFGATLAAGDFNNDGRADLAIGIIFEDVDGADDAGAVAVLMGGGQALAKGPDQFWHQNVSGIDGDCEDDDYFGFANSD